jgi:cytochrome c biogenesis protein ResB
VKKDGTEISGWICSGSYVNQPEALKLNETHSLVMLPAEPRKFSSELNIQTKSGKQVTTTIEVNRPFKIDGWTIYQLGYNTEMGRWSNLSVLELVRDPWLPVVYFGIFLMMAGAAFLFITGKPKNGGTEHVA